MRNIDTVSELSNGHRESETNNDNSVIIVNLRTERNRNLKGIISTVSSFHCRSNIAVRVWQIGSTFTVNAQH